MKVKKFALRTLECQLLLKCDLFSLTDHDTTDGVVEGIINVHGRTKAIYDENGEQIGGGDEIKAEGLVFNAQ